METFPTAKIRNVVLVGHGGSGKTTLAEALLFTAGAIPRTGRVEDGTTVCDFDPEATKRRISVSLALAPLAFEGHKINVIDTPGYADFVTDVAAAMRVADLAVFVVSAVEGVEVQTEIAWRMADELGAPPHRVREQARPRARVVRADARTAEGPLRRRHRAARAAHRLGGRVPWRGRPALRHGRDLRRRLAARQRGSGPRRHGRRGALRARRARRGHRRRRRRPHRAVPRRRGDRRVRARPRACDRHRRGDGVPRPLRQRDEAHRRRPARALHRRGGPGASRHRRRRPDRALRVQDDRGPLRGSREPLQGAPGRAAHRRHARERPHGARRAPAPDLDDAGQGTGAGVGAARR